MCTRIFWSNFNLTKVSARTMDWENSDEPQLWVFPRGMDRTSANIGYPLSWTSRYGSVILSAWDQAASDGLNEAGLAAHTLYLEASQYEDRDSRPGVSTLLWTQYVLDNFATVEDVLTRMWNVQIVSAPVRGRFLGLHLAVEDVNGDSAVIEFINGRRVVHHGKEFRVVASEPSYEEQLDHLQRYRPFGGDLQPSGKITALDRFVRASYFLHYLPRPGTPEEAVAGVQGVARNISMPHGVPFDDFSHYPTWWTTISDLTKRKFYFQSTLSPNLIWLELDRLSLVERARVLTLDPREQYLLGDVADQLEIAQPPF